METERRRHARHQVHYDVLCRTVGGNCPKVCVGRTLNTSTSGSLIEVDADDITAGQLLDLSISLPPAAGILENGGRMSVFARVKRVISPQSSRESSVMARLALEFCDQPRFRS